MSLIYPDLIDLNDYPVYYWNSLIRLGQQISKYPERYSDACNGKIMATLFYEPSTRTQMSFQSAMIRLGGNIIGFDNPLTSSVSKGESLRDTVKIVSNYADIIVMRHPLSGASKAAAMAVNCPVINAGDGGHLHPTQTLTDLLSLKEEKGRLDNLTIGLCGDLKNGRTVHSLVKAMSCYQNNKFVLISTPELKLPAYIKDVLAASGTEYKEVVNLEEAMSQLDVLYMTRIQKERFTSEKEYFEQKDIYILNNYKMLKAKQDLVILHPLPRVDEIAIEVDKDPRAMYFKQVKYGVYIRMALILAIMKKDILPAPLIIGKSEKIKCSNPNCITNNENGVKASFRGIGNNLICEFCDERNLGL